MMYVLYDICIYLLFLIWMVACQIRKMAYHIQIVAYATEQGGWNLLLQGTSVLRLRLLFAVGSGVGFRGV